jgi:enoyl-CoA hydratase/carnithine racemase
LRAGVSACDLGVSWLLPRIVGIGRANELLFTARRFDANEALSMGFVTDVVPVDELTAKALSIADQIKLNPPLQTELTKVGLSVALQSTSLRDVIEFENRQQVLTAMTDDYREAIDSYLRKQTPKYSNR